MEIKFGIIFRIGNVRMSMSTDWMFWRVILRLLFKEHNTIWRRSCSFLVLFELIELILDSWPFSSKKKIICFIIVVFKYFPSVSKRLIFVEYPLWRQDGDGSFQETPSIVYSIILGKGRIQHPSLDDSKAIPTLKLKKKIGDIDDNLFIREWLKKSF